MGPWFMSYRFIKWDVIESDEKYIRSQNLKIKKLGEYIFSK